MKRSWLAFMLILILPTKLFSQTLDSSAHKHPVLRKVAAPIALITMGLLTMDEDDFINRTHILEEKNEYASFYNKHIDDFLQYAPAAMVYGLNLGGVKGKNSVVEETFLLLKSELVMAVVVQTLKSTTHVPRPDNSTYNSFPSGHTAQAFVAATFLHKEYGHKSIWYSVGGYAAATTVGAMRVLSNRHWLSDVFIGAGIGILSTELVYATHQYKWSKRKVKLTGLPVFDKGSYGMYLSLTL
jgi:membrane-associated phospholipid phosphatase